MSTLPATLRTTKMTIATAATLERALALAQQRAITVTAWMGMPQARTRTPGGPEATRMLTAAQATHMQACLLVAQASVCHCSIMSQQRPRASARVPVALPRCIITPRCQLMALTLPVARAQGWCRTERGRAAACSKRPCPLILVRSSIRCTCSCQHMRQQAARAALTWRPTVLLMPTPLRWCTLPVPPAASARAVTVAQPTGAA